jgi:hypothetical protein
MPAVIAEGVPEQSMKASPTPSAAASCGLVAGARVTGGFGHAGRGAARGGQLRGAAGRSASRRMLLVSAWRRRVTSWCWAARGDRQRCGLERGEAGDGGVAAGDALGEGGESGAGQLALDAGEQDGDLFPGADRPGLAQVEQARQPGRTGRIDRVPGDLAELIRLAEPLLGHDQRLTAC